MTTTSIAAPRHETFWHRCMRKVAAFEEAMEMTYDDCQDWRMDRIEAELARLRSEMDTASTPATRQ